jgi:ATP-dependent helicase HrpB
VPLALLDEEWLAGRRIIMLEPRRLAARAAAAWMAGLLGEPVGARVGFRVRGESRVGRGTRIEVVTEGVLTRRIQDDPALDDVGLLMFDEFHERSLHADLGLALALESRSVLRPDLRLLVMSATLDVGAVAHVLGDAPVVHAEGITHPVEIHWRSQPLDGHAEPAVVSTVLRALDEAEGDVLVFLPGAAEIRRVEHGLREVALGPDVDLRPLHGTLPLAAQDAAIAPSPAGRRKVVLATSIAETSLTIEGVRAVVDSGLSRVARFSPRTGLSRLATVRVTRAAAAQRCGRAGRIAPGACYRLWTSAEHASLLEHGSPAILDADLAGLALELALWGSTAESLHWIDAPPAAALSQARELLRELEALDEQDRITPHGRDMASVPLHPRLAHMLLRARDFAAVTLAADLAALLDARDPMRMSADADVDLRVRLDALAALRQGKRIPHAFDAGALRRIAADARRLTARIRPGGDHGVATSPACPGASDGARTPDDAMPGLLLAFAWPDRIAMRRHGARGRFLMRNGRGATLPPESPLAAESFIVAADVDGAGRDARVFLAVPLRETDLRACFDRSIHEEESVAWNDGARAVLAVRRETLGVIVLRESAIAEADDDAIAMALLEGVRRVGVHALPWTREALSLRQRIGFLRTLDPSWPDLSDGALAGLLQLWLRPHVRGARRIEEVSAAALGPALRSLLTGVQASALERLAPTHHVVPTGSRIPIDYSDAAAPALAVRLQEMLGEAETPRIADGRIPLTLHLLSPAHRPLQVTRDLAGFWQSSYREVRKEMRGRYPRHVWPEDPLTAQPTRRAKPRPPRS